MLTIPKVHHMTGRVGLACLFSALATIKYLLMENLRTSAIKCRLSVHNWINCHQLRMQMNMP